MLAYVDIGAARERETWEYYLVVAVSATEIEDGALFGGTIDGEEELETAEFDAEGSN